MHGAASRTYAELDRYRAEIRDSPASLADRRRHAERWRGRARALRATLTALRRLAHLALPVSVLGLLALLAWPVALYPWADTLLELFTAAVMTKMLATMLDLEFLRVQQGAVVLVTALMVAVHPDGWPVALAVGALVSALGLGLRSCRRRAKLADLAWMLDAPREGGGGEWLRAQLTGRHAVTRARLHQLGLRGFDHPGYRRSYRVTGRQPTITPAAPDRGTASRSAKKTVRAQVWARDPWTDLSSLREFFVCCFLGGSQDASAFDFLRAPALSMLDLVSPRGRALRVLLMACEDADGPLLVCNAVFGREGGLVGSRRADDAFVRAELEAYARFAGFSRLFVQTCVTNTRPRLFVRELARLPEARAGGTTCRLIGDPDPVKVEAFDRRAPGSNLYGMLVAEMMGASDLFATQGTLRGAWLPVAGAGLEWAAPQPGGELADRPVGHARAEEPPPTTLTLLGRPLVLHGVLPGPDTAALLAALPEAFPCLDPSPLPASLRVDVDLADRALAGDLLEGRLVLDPRVLVGPDLVRGLSLGLVLAQAVLHRLHPRFHPDLVVDLARRALPDLSTRLAGDLASWDAAARSLATTASPLRRVLDAAVAERWDTHRMFKTRELFAFAVPDGPGPLGVLPSDEALAEDFVAQHRGRLEQHLGALPGAARAVVLDALGDQLAGRFDALTRALRLDPRFSGVQLASAREEIDAFRKRTAKYRLTLPAAVCARIDRLRARASLLAGLQDIEAALRAGKDEAARTDLERLAKGRADALRAEGLEGEVRALGRALRVAPFERLVERWNLDQSW